MVEPVFVELAELFSARVAVGINDRLRAGRPAPHRVLSERNPSLMPVMHDSGGDALPLPPLSKL